MSEGVEDLLVPGSGEGGNARSWGCGWEDGSKELMGNSHEDCFLGLTSPDEFSFSLFKFTL